MTYDETDGRRCGRDRHRRHGCARGAIRRMRRAVHRRTRLYRDADDGILFGVCAGIAHHFGLRPKVVRIAAVISLILFTVPTIVAYALIAWLAPVRDERDVGPTEIPGADDDAPEAPAAGSVEGLARLKSRFRRLEEKFADVEAQMMNDRTA